MKVKKGLFSLTLMSGVVLAACGNGDEAADGDSDDTETETLTLAENQPEDYPTTVGAEEFADLVEEKTDGRYEIDVYAGGQLGEEEEVLEQLQVGSIDLARVNGIPLEQFSDDIGVLSLPFLFEDEEEKRDIWYGEEGDEILDSFEGSGMVGLTFYENGARSFYNASQPVESPEDMEGLQVRVQSSDLAIDIVEALGASASTMEYGEVYSAIQTGVIDGAENNIPSFYTDGHYEIADYFTAVEYQSVPEVLLGSESLWEDLSEEDQQAFEEAAEESVPVMLEAWEEMEEESLQEIEEYGTEIIEVDDIEPWRDAVQPVYDEYEDQYGEWIERLTD